MPSFTFTSPEGQKYTVNGPDGATPEQAFSILQGHIGSGQKPLGVLGTAKDVASSINEGLNRGMDTLIGLPGDAWHGARYLANRALGYNDPINDILPTSESLRQRREAFTGEDPYEPKTTLGKFGRTVGEFAPAAAMAPEKSIGQALLKYGVVPGVASEAAGEATQGTPVEPYARAAAGLAAGLAPAIGEVGRQAGRAFVEPFGEEGRQNVAARQLAGSFTNPRNALVDLEAAKALQQPGSGLGESVPGARPTTGQFTGDEGALELERSFANENRGLYHTNPYGTGADQQNAARATAMAGIQSGGAATDIPDSLRKNAADLREAHDQTVQNALGKAQTASASIGRGMTPEALGSALRSSLQAGRDVAKAGERKLWDAIDPDGTLFMPAAGIKGPAEEIAGSLSKMAKPMGGEEKAIFDSIGGMSSTAPFREVVDLRKRLSAAMGEELRSSGQSPAYARLSQLMGAVESAIENAAVYKSVTDDAAVAAGKMAPENALGSRIGGALDEHRSASGQNSRTEAARTGTVGAAGRAPLSGTVGEGTGRPGNHPGDQGIPRPVARNKVYYPSGSLDVRHEVVNLPDLITSHDADFNVNKAYPAELQPRARGSAPARDQVNSISARLEPERLGPSPEANSGSPIVGPDNVVESGNGRTLAIGQLYRSGRGGAYRKWLESQGFDTAGMDQPVLVARRRTELSPDERVAFAHSANSASGLRMNATEQAAADARLITPSSLEHIEAGSAINSEKNRSFVRSFLSQLPASERGGMLDAKGSLSQTGIRRLEAAMSARAYGDSEFIARAFDAADPNIRGLAGALIDASGPWMKMRQAAREGVIDAGHDVTQDLMTAARAIIRARDSGRPVSEVLNQGDMFGGETSSLGRSLILNAKGQVASRDVIARRLEHYATEAQKNLAGPSMFGDVVKPADVLKTTLKGEATPPAPASSRPIEAREASPSAQAPRQQEASAGPQPTLVLDEGAAARHKAARAATRERAQTFDRGPVGDVLRKGSLASEYRIPDSAVPGKVWVTGPRGAETVRAYEKASGSTERLVDAAAESLRREAMTDGIINPVKFDAWRERYADSIRALPEQARSLFDDAASASRAYEEAAIARKEAIDANETTLVKRFLGLTTGQDVTRTVGAIFGARNATEQMKELAARVAGNPEAKEGLKKAIADHIASIATGTTEAGASGADKLKPSVFQTFLRKNEEALRAAGFSEAQISNMRALANDLKRSQRTMQATALPSSPNTAADVMGSMKDAAKEAKGPSLLSKVLAASWAGMHFGGVSGALTGLASALGEHVTRAMRGAGMAKARDLVQAGILDPEIGRQLLRRASGLPDRETEKALARAIARRSVFAVPGAMTSARGEPSEPSASVSYGIKRLGPSMSAGQSQRLREVVGSRDPVGAQVRSSLDKFGRAATALKGSPGPRTLAVFLRASRNLSSNLADAGVDLSADQIAGAVGGR